MNLIATGKIADLVSDQVTLSDSILALIDRLEAYHHVGISVMMIDESVLFFRKDGRQKEAVH